jgi:hypothetical protein
MTKENQFSYENIKAALEAEVISGDGHTIFKPEFYDKYFDVDHLVVDHASGVGKHTIFDSVTGEPMESLMGVYSLSFMYWVGEQLGLEFRECYGRGSQAQAIKVAVEQWVEGYEQAALALTE